jgi:hypothetical protein
MIAAGTNQSATVRPLRWSSTTELTEESEHDGPEDVLRAHRRNRDRAHDVLLVIPDGGFLLDDAARDGQGLVLHPRRRARHDDRLELPERHDGNVADGRHRLPELAQAVGQIFDVERLGSQLDVVRDRLRGRSRGRKQVVEEARFERADLEVGRQRHHDRDDERDEQGDLRPE